ncbi:MAG: alpha/beta fold hydrolase [Luteolibacter sp.]
MRSSGGSLDFLEHLPPPQEPRFWKSPAGPRLAWNEFGDPAGRPVLYCHGWPSSRMQAALVHHLARERGLRVIAPDRPGMGRSERVPGRTLESWPETIAAFMDSLGVATFAQLGVSGGGPYVLACAALLPERVTTSAVLCGAVALADGQRRGLHPVYQILIPLRHLPHACFTMPLKLAARIATAAPDEPPVSWILKTLPQADRKLLLANPEAQHVLAMSFAEGVRQGGRGVMEDAGIYLQHWNLPLENITRPIRYWHGGMDRNISADMARQFVSSIPHARLDVDPDEGHFSLAIHRARDAMDHLTA